MSAFVGHPKTLKSTSLAPFRNRNWNRFQTVPKQAPQGLSNQVVFGDCGAQYLIFVVVFWKIANMQSAHACAVQTAFQALPTRPKVSPNTNTINCHFQTFQKQASYIYIYIYNIMNTRPVRPNTCSAVRVQPYVFSRVRVQPRTCSAAIRVQRYVFSRTCSATYVFSRVPVQLRTCSAATCSAIRVRRYLFSCACSAMYVFSRTLMAVRDTSRAPGGPSAAPGDPPGARSRGG